MVEKTVSIAIDALGVTATKAEVTEYRVSENIYVYDLYGVDEALVAKSRYIIVEDAPFTLTSEEKSGLSSL